MTRLLKASLNILCKLSEMQSEKNQNMHMNQRSSLHRSSQTHKGSQDLLQNASPAIILLVKPS